MAKDAPADPAIAKIIAPYKEQLDAEMNEVIGTSAVELTKAKPESSLGNFVADLVHEQSELYFGASIDFGVVNYGGLRIPNISKGPITTRRVFELMPFDNELVVLKVKGTVVQKLFDRMADYGGWPISHQVSYTINKGLPENILINGAPIDEEKVYKIAISDYVANGGDKCSFFVDEAQVGLTKKFRDAIIENIKMRTANDEIIESKIEGRVIIKE